MSLTDRLGGLHADPPPRRFAIFLAVCFVLTIVATLVNVWLTLVLLGCVLIVCLSIVSARDAALLLTGYLAMVLLIPADYVVADVGAVGTPAVMLSYVAGVWWLITRFSPELMPSKGRQPVRTAVFVFLAVMLAAYAAGFGRPLFGDESSGANRKLIVLVGLCGVTLLAADGITELRRLDTLMRRFVFLTAAVAVIGLLQATVDLDLATYLTLPGLSLGGELGEITTRGSAARVRGTSSHAIEYGVILAAVMPIALHYAFAAGTRAKKVSSWLAVGLMTAAIPMSISRSALLGLVVGILCLLPAWTAKRRLQVVALGIAALAVFVVTVPGVIASYKSLILNVGEDASIQGRTEDYDVAQELVPEKPVLGRGLGTFIPRRYTFLDNEYLGILIETGFVGLTSFLMLLLVGGYCALRAARTCKLVGEQDTRALSQAVFASIAALAVTFATFDGLGFPQAAALLFFQIGIAGATWRLTQALPGLTAGESSVEGTFETSARPPGLPDPAEPPRSELEAAGRRS